MIPFINLMLKGVESTDVFPSEPCDISISNSTSAVSLTKVSSSDATEKFVIPARYLNKINGPGITLDLVGRYLGNDGTPRGVTLAFITNGQAAISGTTSTLANTATVRAYLFRASLRRIGDTAGYLTVDVTFGGANVLTAAGTTTRQHTITASLPAVGNNVTLAVTAQLAVASSDVTLSVERRRVFVW